MVSLQVASSPPDASFIRDKRVRVKLTGDGANIGKHLHVVNFAFTILDEGDLAYSAAGNHCIAIFKETEDYDSLKRCLHDIIRDVEALPVNDFEFEINYYLGGDWKFLAVITGIDSATSTYSCIWCKCPTDMTRPESGPSVMSSSVPELLKRTQQFLCPDQRNI